MGPDYFLVFTCRSLCFDLIVLVWNLLVFFALAFVLQHFAGIHVLADSRTEDAAAHSHAESISYEFVYRFDVTFEETNYVTTDMCKSRIIARLYKRSPVG